jgi:hypothetical protein
VSFKGAGLYELRVRAQGQVLNGVAPHMNVYVDGAKILSKDPWSGSWLESTAQLRVSAASTKTIHVEFTNDAKTSTGDRNLLIDRVDVRWISA